MSGYYKPACQVLYYRRKPGGRGLTGPYPLNMPYQINASLTTSNSVGQAQVTVFDPQLQIAQQLSPQPMDVLTIAANSPYSPNSLQTIWTGYVDMAVNHFDLQVGNTLVMNCSSPYKLWENTTLGLGVGQNQANLNDPAALAIASFRGISAQDVIRVTAQKVGFPGPLAFLPANPQIYFGPQTAYGGLWSYTVPDNVFTEPDLQTYSAVVQGMLGDTANELFLDNLGNLIFRPVGYLNPTPNPLRILPQDIISSDLGRSDQGVITEVRVRWAYSYDFNQDGTWVAPQTMIDQLGPRVKTISAPWIHNQAAANFLATAVGQMGAANVAIGNVVLHLDPAFQLGTICQAQDPTAPSGFYGYYYIAGIVYTMTWGQPFTMQLQLGFGRSGNQSFPYIGSQTIPLISNFNANGARAIDGVPTANALSVGGNGQLSASLATTFDGTLGPDQITANPALFPVGSKIILTDAAGNAIGPSPDGSYTVVAGGTANQTTLGINAHVAAGQVTAVPQRIGPAMTAATSGSSSTASGSGTPAVPSPGGAPVPPPAATTPTSTSANGTLVPAETSQTPDQFTYWPVPRFTSISQYYGDTTEPGETPNYRTADGVVHTLFHEGIDIACGGNTPIIVCPVSGGIVTTASPQLDAAGNYIGYGNLTVLTVGSLDLYFGHQSKYLVVKGDMPLAGAAIGVVGTTGNSTGDHLHFGVFDHRTSTFVDPFLYLRGAIGQGAATDNTNAAIGL